MRSSSTIGRRSGRVGQVELDEVVTDERERGRRAELRDGEQISFQPVVSGPTSTRQSAPIRRVPVNAITPSNPPTHAGQSSSTTSPLDPGLRREPRRRVGDRRRTFDRVRRNVRRWPRSSRRIPPPDRRGRGTTSVAESLQRRVVPATARRGASSGGPPSARSSPAGLVDAGGVVGRGIARGRLRSRWGRCAAGRGCRRSSGGRVDRGEDVRLVVGRPPGTTRCR